MEDEKQNKVTVIITILLLILVVLLLFESVQLSEIKSKIKSTDIYWQEFGQKTENESNICVNVDTEDKK